MHFAKAHTIQKPSQLSVRAASLYVAIFFVVAVTAQLFAYEDLPSLIESYGILANNELVPVLAAIIVTLEVAALPYLLWMKTSALMRIISFLSAWAALLYWLLVGLWQSLVDVVIANVGLFGAKIVLPQGWWLVSFMLTLLILLTYVSLSTRLTPRHLK